MIHGDNDKDTNADEGEERRTMTMVVFLDFYVLIY